MSDVPRDKPTAAPPHTAPLELEPDLYPGLPRRIGRYELVKLIATGGMGMVYEAIQDQPRRTVAIKFMRGGFGSSAAIKRFEDESQLLARLRHPGIAQVFEAGTHDLNGLAVPYFVMEYLPGAMSISEYARQHNFSIARRIELMTQVCAAVQHGHEQGIIHRDLKPGNIVVDSSGQLRVIDFGIAHTNQSPQPASGAGTLAYMSPEQCRGEPGMLDARSDVYSLGVVGYELLCGRLPYEVTQNIEQATQTICEQLPLRAQRPLRGDLEFVLRKALEKDPKDRYATAAQLGEDLSHVLKMQPIRAQRGAAVCPADSRAAGRYKTPDHDSDSRDPRCRAGDTVDRRAAGRTLDAG